MGGKAGVDASAVQPVVGTFGHWDGTDGSELVFWWAVAGSHHSQS